MMPGICTRKTRIRSWTTIIRARKVCFRTILASAGEPSRPHRRCRSGNRLMPDPWQLHDHFTLGLATGSVSARLNVRSRALSNPAAAPHRCNGVRRGRACEPRKLFGGLPREANAGGDRGTDPPLRLGKCASRHSFARLLLEYSASLAINAVWWANLPLAYRREIDLDLVSATKPSLLPYMAGERLVRDVPPHRTCRRHG